MKSLLWITPKWPFPIEDGSRVAFTSLVRALTAQGVAIDHVALVAPDEEIRAARAQEELGVRRVYVIKRPSVVHGAASHALAALTTALTQPSVPLTMRYYCGRPIRDALVGVLQGEEACLMTPELSALGNDWNAVVYEGLHAASHALEHGEYQPLPGAPAVIYRAQNVEAALWSRKAAEVSRAPIRWFLRHQARLVKRFERSLITSASSVATVSPEDLEEFRRWVPSVNGEVVPVGYTFNEPKLFQDRSEVRVLFLGRLDWHPNRDGLLWLLEHVWPEVARRRRDVSLTIAGSGNGAYLNRFTGLPSVTVRGRVADLDEVYQSCDACVVPLFYGSGTRVKVIEAARYGRPCVSTVAGIEGVSLLPDQHYLQAETREEWIHALSTLDREHLAQVGRAAFERARTSFSATSAAQRFAAMLDRIAPHE